MRRTAHILFFYSGKYNQIIDPSIGDSPTGSLLSVPLKDVKRSFRTGATPRHVSPLSRSPI